MHEHTVGKWRRRFLKARIEGLSDEPRPGRPRTLTDDQVAKVVERTLSATPADATHWSLRSMNGQGKRPFAHDDLAHLGRLRRAAAPLGDLQASGDPHFVDKVRDIIGLYLSPPDRALVLCVDEKSQIQALDRTQPVLPMLPGMPERRTHDYKRHGTTSLFAALDVATVVIGKCYRRHRAREFLDFLKEIDHAFPTGWTSTSSWTTTPPTRRRRSRGWRGGRTGMFTLRRFGVLDQSGRTLVRRTDAQATAARRAHLHPPARTISGPSSKNTTKTPQVDQIGRRHPRRRKRFCLRVAKFMPRTLDSGD